MTFLLQNWRRSPLLEMVVQDSVEQVDPRLWAQVKLVSRARCPVAEEHGPVVHYTALVMWRMHGS